MIENEPIRAIKLLSYWLKMLQIQIKEDTTKLKDDGYVRLGIEAKLQICDTESDTRI